MNIVKVPAQVIIDMMRVVAEHHEEARRGGEWPLVPDFDVYHNLDRAGLLQCHVAYDAGEVVGYTADILSPCALHYTNHSVAVNDMIYVKPEYRHKGVLQELINTAVAHLKSLGCELYTVNLKAHNPCKSAMNALGFQMAEVVWHLDI